jgi:hypothetical protein
MFLLERLFSKDPALDFALTDMLDAAVDKIV